MPRPSILAVCAVLGLIAAAPLHEQSREADILAVVRRLFDGMRAGDSGMVRSVFAADAQMVSVADSAGSSNVTRSSPDRFVAAVGRPHAQVWDERIWDTEVRVDGGLASVWTKYAFYLGDRLNHCGVDVFQLAHGDEGWKIIYLADTRRRESCWQPPRG